MGVAVDGNGKVWSANYNSNTLSHIDPALDDGNRKWDLTVNMGSGAKPYNYGDMVGSMLIMPPNSGSYTVVYDNGVSQGWGDVQLEWTDSVPLGSKLTVEVSSSTDGRNYSVSKDAAKSTDLTVPDEQYLKIQVSSMLKKFSFTISFCEACGLQLQ